MDNKICNFCKIEFSSKRKKQIFCNLECLHNSLKKQIECICKNCGNNFNRSQKSAKEAKYCSVKCRGEYKSKQYNYPSIQRICLYCDKQFLVEKPCKKNKFCSKKCWYNHNKQSNDRKISALLPEIKEFRKTHTLAETSSKFCAGEEILKRHGIYATEHFLSCPDNLSELQQEIFNGNMLGDGCIGYIKKENHNSRFSIGQKLESAEYIKALFDIYKPFSCGYSEGKTKKPSTINDKISHDPNNWNGEYSYNCFFYTLSHPVFTKARHEWYELPYVKKSPKKIPINLKLTWRTLAIWICDDGSNHCRLKQGRSMTIHTESFTENQVEFLIEKLKNDLSLNATMNFHEGKPTIRIGGEEHYRLIEEIKPFVLWECFKYKCVNREKINRNTSGYIGVTRHHTGRWKAYKSFRTNGIFSSVNIGLFDTPQEASDAREVWLNTNRISNG